MRTETARTEHDAPRGHFERLRWWLPNRSWRDNGWRWRVATLMDKLPGTCWVDSVTWAQDTNREAIERADSWRGVLPTSSSKGCGPGNADYERNGCCYCGKFMTPELRARVQQAASR